ncbi:MAG: hypothetical protein AAFQ80_07625 [Cyanobacteria bacterium J06621_8]
MLQLIRLELCSLLTNPTGVVLRLIRLELCPGFNEVAQFFLSRIRLDSRCDRLDSEERQMLAEWSKE